MEIISHAEDVQPTKYLFIRSFHGENRKENMDDELHQSSQASINKQQIGAPRVGHVTVLIGTGALNEFSVM